MPAAKCRGLRIASQNSRNKFANGTRRIRAARRPGLRAGLFICHFIEDAAASASAGPRPVRGGARLHDSVIRASQRYARAYFVGLNDVRSHNNPAATERSYPSHSLTNFYSALTTYRPCPVGDFKIAAPQTFARHAPIKNIPVPQIVAHPFPPRDSVRSIKRLPSRPRFQPCQQCNGSATANGASHNLILLHPHRYALLSGRCHMPFRGSAIRKRVSLYAHRA